MSFFRKVLAVSFGQIFGNFISMIAGVVFARMLGPSGIGKYEIFRSFDTILVTIFSMGIGNASMYFLNNVGVSPSNLIATTLRACLVIGGLLGVCMASIIYLFPTYFSYNNALVIGIFICGSICSFHVLALKTVLTAALQSFKLTLIEQIPRIVLAAFALLAVIHSHIEVSFALIAMAVGNVMALILLSFFLKSKATFKVPFSWSLFRGIFKYGIKLSACDLLFVLTSNISLLLLKYFSNNDFHSVGLFSRAVAISGIISMIPYTVGPLLYAKLALIKDKDDLLYRSHLAMRIGVFFSCLLSIIVLLLRKYIVVILYGTAFIEAEKAVLFLAPSLIFFSVSNVSLNLLASQGKAHINMMVLLSSFLVVGFLGVVLIPNIGIQGASLAVLSGNIFTAIVSFYCCQKYFNFNLKSALLIQVVDIKSLIRPFVYR